MIVPENEPKGEISAQMHQFPSHSAENEPVLTNEWNNNFVDNVSGGVQSLGIGVEK